MGSLSVSQQGESLRKIELPSCSSPQMTRSSIASSTKSHCELSRQRVIISCGAAVSCLGHGDERLSEVMVAQMSKVDYAYSLMLSNPACEELATKLVEGTKGRMAKAFIVCSGSVRHDILIASY